MRLTVRIDGHARNRQRVGQDQRVRSVGRVRNDRASDLRRLPEAEQIRDDREAAAGRARSENTRNEIHFRRSESTRCGR